MNWQERWLMNWQEYGEGLCAVTDYGTYTIGPTRCGWWLSFHCACCLQLTKVVPMSSCLDKCKALAQEHHERLDKRYQEAMAR